MPTDKPQFSAAYTRILARALNVKRNAILPLLKETDLTPDDIEFERRDLNYSQQYQIIKNALTISKQASLGLIVGEQSELSMHGLVGLAAMSAATLYEVLMIFAKYHHVRAPFFEMRLETTNDHLIVKLKAIDTLDEPINRFLIEAGASMLQSMVEHIVGREVHEAHLHLPLHSAKNWGIYHQYFHCPVIPSEDDFAHYSLPLALAKSPSPNRDDLLRQRAEEGCKSILGKISEQTTSTGKVEELLNFNREIYLTLEECAKLLNVSPRTLIRRLEAEQTSFHTLIEARRKALVVGLLANPNISIEAIGLELGYEYTTNFRRAFKRWFTVTPSEYRQQQLNSDR
jgi:AraC-like DNA-binding protein